MFLKSLTQIEDSKDRIGFQETFYEEPIRDFKIPVIQELPVHPVIH